MDVFVSLDQLKLDTATHVHLFVPFACCHIVLAVSWIFCASCVTTTRNPSRTWGRWENCSKDWMQHIMVLMAMRIFQQVKEGMQIWEQTLWSLSCQDCHQTTLQSSLGIFQQAKEGMQILKQALWSLSCQDCHQTTPQSHILSSLSLLLRIHAWQTVKEQMKANRLPSICQL